MKSFKAIGVIKGGGIEIEMHSRAFAKFRRLAIFWPFVRGISIPVWRFLKKGA